MNEKLRAELVVVTTQIVVLLKVNEKHILKNLLHPLIQPCNSYTAYTDIHQQQVQTIRDTLC